MMDAATFKKFEAIYQLLEAGADHSYRNEDGADLAQRVLRATHLEPDEDHWRDKVIDLLRTKGVDFEVVRKELEAWQTQ